MQSWKRIGSQKLLSHPRLEVYEDKAELPNGHITDYIRFDSQDAAMVIAVRKDKKILVQKEYNYPTDEFLYQFPGGKIEAGEDPRMGAKREFAEEAQLKGNLKEIGWFYMNNRRHGGKMHVFVATDLQAHKAKPDATEEFEDFWFTESEIEELIKIGEFQTNTGLSAWTLYRLRD